MLGLDLAVGIACILAGLLLGLWRGKVQSRIGLVIALVAAFTIGPLAARHGFEVGVMFLFFAAGATGPSFFRDRLSATIVSAWATAFVFALPLFVGVTCWLFQSGCF